MKLQQLRYLCEVASQKFNLSKAAQKLHTSQPAISKQIQLLEEELGVSVFIRNGKRLTQVTPPGQIIIQIARKILQETENLKRPHKTILTKQAAHSLSLRRTRRHAMPYLR